MKMPHGFAALLIALSLSSTIHAQAAPAASAVAQPSPALLAARARHVDHMLQRLEPLGFSGAVALIHQGDVLLEKGYGSRDSTPHHTIDGQTAFDIGSMSKTFTAAVVLRLADAGQLSIDDSVARFFPDAPRDQRAITLRQLLSHTSGLAEFHDRHGDFENLSRDTAVARILSQPLDGQGSFSYSNSGYTLLAAIAERVTGTPFGALLEREIFSRTGMAHAGLYADARWGGERHLAHGFLERTDAGSPATWAPGRELWALIGNGGVVATLDDLIAWDRALRERRVMSERAHQAFIHSETEVEAGVGYALGWYILDDASHGKSFGHTGANDFGFASAYLHFLTSDLTIILLVNRQPDADVDIAIYRSAVLAAIKAAMLDGPGELPPAVRALDARGIEPLLGRWQLDDGSVIEAQRRPDAIRLVANGPRASMLLAGLDSAGYAHADSLARKTTRIVEGMLRDDYAPLGESLRDPRALPRWSAYLTKKLAELRAKGPITGFSVLSVAPAWWSEDHRIASVIRVEGADSAVFRLHWDHGSVFQLGGASVQSGPAVLVMRDRKGHLIGYQTLTGSRVAIERVGAPNATRLCIRSAGAVAEAVRRARP